MQLLVFTNAETPRLDYIVTTLLTAIGITSFQSTTNVEFYHASKGAKINYSYNPLSPQEVWIKPVGLLFESGVNKQEITCFDFEGCKAFFKTEGSFPFDIFAASFYLISRYEEYLPHQLDEYGRYAHTNSLAFKEGFLHLPLVNIWMKRFSKALQERFPDLILEPANFNFLPTYDIDIAWSYLNKGLIRNVGGFVRSLIKVDLKSVQERLAVLAGKQQDPYDIFDWLNNLHQTNNLHPHYFFLLADKQMGYDKNIHPSSPLLQLLIKRIAVNNSVGIHPSWQSGDDEALLKIEIQTLRSITEKAINSSRQHYIRMTMLKTYRTLIENGIEQDFSIGYGSINGFRASYCLPYKWYDLKKEQKTELILHPFCYMDANSFYEQHFTLQQAKEELQHYYKITRQVSGQLITIFHNHTLGNKKLFKGWMEMYGEFCKEVFEPGF